MIVYALTVYWCLLVIRPNIYRIISAPIQHFDSFFFSSDGAWWLSPKYTACLVHLFCSWLYSGSNIFSLHANQACAYVLFWWTTPKWTKGAHVNTLRKLASKVHTASGGDYRGAYRLRSYRTQKVTWVEGWRWEWASKIWSSKEMEEPGSVWFFHSVHSFILSDCLLRAISFRLRDVLYLGMYPEVEASISPQSIGPLDYYKRTQEHNIRPSPWGTCAQKLELVIVG